MRRLQLYIPPARTPQDLFSHNQTGSASKQGTAATTKPEPPPELPRRLLEGSLRKETFSILAGKPILWLQSEIENFYALPIHHRAGDRQTLGHVVLPRWFSRITTLFEKVSVLGNAGTSPISVEYWEKFFLEYVRLLAVGRQGWKMMLICS
jgi:hypothetical protein